MLLTSASLLPHLCWGLPTPQQDQQKGRSLFGERSSPTAVQRKHFSWKHQWRLSKPSQPTLHWNNNKRLGACNNSHYALICADQTIAKGRDVCWLLVFSFGFHCPHDLNESLFRVKVPTCFPCMKNKMHRWPWICVYTDCSLYFVNCFAKFVECVAILDKMSISLLYFWNAFVSPLLHPQVIELLLKNSSNLDRFPRCQPSLYENANEHTACVELVSATCNQSQDNV